MRYLVFAFDEFYPCGGLADCDLMTDSIEEAKHNLLSHLSRDYQSIYDTKTGDYYYYDFANSIIIKEGKGNE